ncbi:MAG: hypothetical protein E7773_14815 [Sphingomonas sp.]|uniref:hypothetical protein n=1 Tax=Sphingomonas sp. TaxID=28214 RepID=UPI0011F6AF18|nr:hypothetical protein [Sphingomonas sp.]THD34458.1 MAG: hypothetical protein E7773_14815 [Sphingomonas sp.]
MHRGIMEQPPADDASAPYLTQALFLARTMRAPAGARLLNAKRARVFALATASAAPEADVEFAGMKLRFAIAALARKCGTLPADHHIPETVLVSACGRLDDAYPTATSARAAMLELLGPVAPYIDPHETETVLRDQIVARRSERYRVMRDVGVR